MPRLLNLRALCAHCEKAEANVWSVPHRTPLCKKCAVGQSTQPVPIVSASVVTALCSQCGIAPASRLAVSRAAPLCEICAGGAKGDVVPLRDSDAVAGIVFDKMDFSGLQGKGAGMAHAVQGERVDLSYYKTKVPQSLVGERKRAPEESKSNASNNSPRRRRR